MTGVVSDLRSACRQFLRNRGLTIVALTALALGIGLSVAITSVANAVLVRPLPYDRPEDLVMVWRASPGPNRLAGFRDPRRLAREILTPAMVLRWRDQALPFRDFAVVHSWEYSVWPRIDVLDGAGVDRLRGTFATANLFDVLGVKTAIGRTFADNEGDVAVLSDGLWRRRFGADPSVVGKTITVAAGQPRERRMLQIIGVLPERLRFTYPEDTEIWLPLSWPAIAGEFQNGLMYRVVARLRQDTPIAAAEAAMQAFRDPIDVDPRWLARIWLEPVHEYAVGPSRAALVLVSALTLLVLIGGAINAATAFAASTVSRLREVGVRRALGASQGRLVRQAFTEAAMLAGLAGVVGLATVSLAFPALRALLPAGMPGIEAVRLDGLTLVAVGGAVAFSTLVAGLVPAWLSVRHRAHPRLEDARATTTSLAGLRLRMGLLGVQFTLVSMLLITGVMLVRSFWNLIHVDKGFEAGANVYAAEIQLMNPAHRDKPFQQYEGELLRRLRELSYVEAASLTSAIPLRGVDFVRNVRRPDGQRVSFNGRHVDPGYFDVMGMRLLSGRWLTDADTIQSGWVALVSESLAAALYPGENPLGQFLEGRSGTRIVGVVADIRARSLAERPMPALYWPRALLTSNQIWVLVRTTMGAQQVAADLRRIVQDVYPEQPIQRFATLQQVLDDSVADRRAYAVIASALAFAILLLSGLGLSGHLSHVVVERARDLAIRSALGASTRRQARLLVRHIVPPLMGGIGVAMAALYFAQPRLAPFLFEIERFDAISSVASAVLVTVFTAVAVILPARRLSKLDPAKTLQSG